MSRKDARTPLEGGATFPLQHRLTRAIWIVVWFTLASWTPRQLHAWRRFLLSSFGAKLGKSTDVLGSARVWYPANLVMKDHALIAANVNCYNMAKVHLGRHALVSQGTFLCGGTHRIDSPDFTLVTRDIIIEDFAWVCADAFVGPGVTIGEGAVLAACGAAFENLEPWGVYRGNPASYLRQRRRQ